ncbi:MAG: hypothetical protein PHN82_04825 [bacterium]|nr:hypothetical protein [bacterium]
MAILRIYGDEAGTMPMNDGDPPFVAATVAILGDPPTIDKPNGHVDWLVKKIKELNAFPHISYIYPDRGYGNKIQSKLSKMNTMARATRLITGANRHYLTEEGIGLRNWVWQFCMGQAIAQATVSAIAKDFVDGLSIVLDQKTMPKPTRRIFIDSVHRLSGQLNGILQAARRMNRDEAELFKSRLRFTNADMCIIWSDSSLAGDSQGGLWLAHYLAGHYQKGLSRGKEMVVRERLSKAGFARVEKDITDMITAPINRASIERWKRNTGLEEPVE